MHKLLITSLLFASLASPVLAQTAIKGIELSPTDAARVDRQCDALRFRQPDSLASSEPEEPAPGAIVADPSSYWAENADGDRWTLYSDPSAPTVQYEHTVVATPRGAVVLTLPG